MSKLKKEDWAFEEITFKEGHTKDVVYLSIGWEVPLQASKEYWIATYSVDPTKNIEKKTRVKD